MKNSAAVISGCLTQVSSTKERTCQASSGGRNHTVMVPRHLRATPGPVIVMLHALNTLQLSIISSRVTSMSGLGSPPPRSTQTYRRPISLRKVWHLRSSRRFTNSYVDGKSVCRVGGCSLERVSEKSLYELS
jgi:hypothetical protein